MVQGQGQNLFGRNWMNEFQLEWRKIFHASEVQRGITAGARESTTIDSILKRFLDVFDKGRGQLKKTVASFCVDLDTKPRFYKPRQVAFAHREKEEQAMRKLERGGTIRPTSFSEWTAPILPVLKTDGSMRICDNYRLTINQAGQRDNYTLPRIEDMLASL